MRPSLSCALLVITAVLTTLLRERDLAAKEIDYLTQIKPILLERCVACHGPLKQSGALRLDTAALAIAGGESGPAITVSGDSESSLIERITAKDEAARMPPEGEPLTGDQIAMLQRWIAEGAKAPLEKSLADPKDHWAFRKVVRPPVPPGLTGSPVDRFIEQRLLEQGLKPLPEADKATLLRRVYLDLVGVPPQREDVQEFLADERSDAYERAVDRLLASPLYAQRWAKHWMDIWRYSDWYGSRDLNELRNSRRHIWRWRDWIIDSIAADKGHDHMLQEMLAADEVSPGDEQAQRALGYLGRNYYVFNRHVWLQDTVDHAAVGFLGLTFKCARCHDHKYDPISQEDYYRLRAFFEPHNVRTDPLPGKPELLQGNLPAGAASGAKLKEGYDIVYDADPASPTYLLVRGNEKHPATDRPLSPGLPSVLGDFGMKIQAIGLPVEVYYPDLREPMRHERLVASQAAITKAEAALQNASELEATAREKLATLVRGKEAEQPTTAAFLEEEFTVHRADVWKIHGGDWKFADGRLSLSRAGSFCTIATLQEHPRDFHATLKYRTMPGGAFGSIGLFFDLVDLKEAQGVYTHVNASSSGVQAFHRTNGDEVYPQAGIVKSRLQLNEEVTLEIKVRGQDLSIWLNGESKLNCTMPLPRQQGRFGLWMHEGLGEFDSLTIRPLELSAEELKTRLAQQEAETQLAKLAVNIAAAEYRSLEARIAAEIARFGTGSSSDEKQSLSRAASLAERQLALVGAQSDAFTATRELDIARKAAKADDAPSQQRLQAAEAKLKTKEAAVASTLANLAKEDTTYAPLGPIYPATSTGRRLALANWLIHRDNPLTARVAVNHVWKRHFGTGLVPSVANFGLNGKPPTHPELLDWLAAEFMESGWSQRHLHRLIVTSEAYRRSSEDGRHQDTIARNCAIDADNKAYWRANPRRMESEVVRDSLLALTDSLDSSLSGPELDPAQADASPRRSLYFRLTPDDQATFLQLFDGASPAECYERTESVVPQQALALVNSPLALRQSRLLARELSNAHADDGAFIRAAFAQIISREPDEAEQKQCAGFLARQSDLLASPQRLTRQAIGVAANVAPAADPVQRARENLVHVLINHNDFVSVR
jgi:mono/diheme cytochrome c family protein